MSLFPVVQRILDKAGQGFVEVRREDGHGSVEANRTHVSADKDLKRVTGSGAVAPNATSTVLSYLAAQKVRAHSVVVSGDGDALVSVLLDSVKQDEVRLSAICRREVLRLSMGVDAGSRLDVTVRCEGLATSNYFVALVYE